MNPLCCIVLLELAVATAALIRIKLFFSKLPRNTLRGTILIPFLSADFLTFDAKNNLLNVSLLLYKYRVVYQSTFGLHSHFAAFPTPDRELWVQGFHSG